MRFDWFGLKGRQSLPKRGPRWFMSRGANFLYFSLGGICAITVPWFWSHAALESRGFDRGWNAGYDSGWRSKEAVVPSVGISSSPAG
jgi:hypothetical protein